MSESVVNSYANVFVFTTKEHHALNFIFTYCSPGLLCSHKPLALLSSHLFVPSFVGMFADVCDHPPLTFPLQMPVVWNSHLALHELWIGVAFGLIGKSSAFKSAVQELTFMSKTKKSEALLLLHVSADLMVTILMIERIFYLE